MERLVNFFYEVEMLQRTARSGFAFLGAGQQSVADHSHGVALIALALAEQGQLKVDRYKLLLMALLHDIGEARTGDLNYVYKRYLTIDEQALSDDFSSAYPFLPMAKPLLEEYHAQQSTEAQLVKEADRIELLVVLKRLEGQGIAQASGWFDATAAKLQLEVGRALLPALRSQEPHQWWRQLL